MIGLKTIFSLFRLFTGLTASSCRLFINSASSCLVSGTFPAVAMLEASVLKNRESGTEVDKNRKTSFHFRPCSNRYHWSISLTSERERRDHICVDLIKGCDQSQQLPTFKLLALFNIVYELQHAWPKRIGQVWERPERKTQSDKKKYYSFNGKIEPFMRYSGGPVSRRCEVKSRSSQQFSVDFCSV